MNIEFIFLSSSYAFIFFYYYYYTRYLKVKVIFELLIVVCFFLRNIIDLI